MKRLALRLSEFWFEPAPASRLALLRIFVAGYALWYVSTRADTIAALARASEDLFRPVGIWRLLSVPLPPVLVDVLVAATLASGVLFLIGFKFRLTGPLFAALMFATFCYRNSWSMIYHTHNVLVLHALILGLTPAGDALSWDAWRRRAAATAGGGGNGESWRYGWPIRLMCAATACAYFLAGVAKLASELGASWAGGASLRSQIAVDAIRKELFGSAAPELTFLIYDNLLLFTVLGIGTFVFELGAPAAIFNRRLGKLWALVAWSIHWGIFFIMGIRFRYQMSGLIFASFFDVEKLLRWIDPRSWRTRLKRSQRDPELQELGSKA